MTYDVPVLRGGDVTAAAALFSSPDFPVSWFDQGYGPKLGADVGGRGLGQAAPHGYVDEIPMILALDGPV